MPDEGLSNSIYGVVGAILAALGLNGKTIYKKAMAFLRGVVEEEEKSRTIVTEELKQIIDRLTSEIEELRTSADVLDDTYQTEIKDLTREKAELVRENADLRVSVERLEGEKKLLEERLRRRKSNEITSSTPNQPDRKQDHSD